MLSFNDNNAQYLIVNSELTGSDTLKKNESGAIVLPFEGPVIYEVIRFINGKGLFLEDHFRRLENSFQIEGIENPVDLAAFKEYASVLLSVNEERDCNVKIMSTGKDFVVYLSKKFYPGPAYYEKGIRTACIQIERPSPNAKIRRSDYIERIETFKQANEIFEALLMNAEGYLTEGSKSNLFLYAEGNRTPSILRRVKWFWRALCGSMCLIFAVRKIFPSSSNRSGIPRWGMWRHCLLQAPQSMFCRLQKLMKYSIILRKTVRYSALCMLFRITLIQ